MENKGFGWSSMKYLEGCRIAVSANRLAWTASYGAALRGEPSGNGLGACGSGSRAKVGLTCGGEDDDRARQADRVGMG